MTTKETSTRQHLAHVRAFQDQPIVFFTVCAHQRRTILADPRVHAILRDVWGLSLARNGWCVGHYVIMPDHVHFFGRATKTSVSMADWVRIWKSVSSKAIRRTLHVAPGIWQRDYFDRYLRSGESYSEKWEYVRRNPVRAGLVRKAEDWPYWGKIEDLTF